MMTYLSSTADHSSPPPHQAPPYDAVTVHLRPYVRLCLQAARSAFDPNLSMVIYRDKPIPLKRLISNDGLTPLLVYHANCVALMTFGRKVWPFSTVRDDSAPFGAVLASDPEVSPVPLSWQLLFLQDAWLHTAKCPSSGALPDITDIVHLWIELMKEIPRDEVLPESAMIPALASESLAGLRVLGSSSAPTAQPE